MAASSRAQEREKRKNGLREIPQFAMNNAIYIEEWYVFGLSISFASFNFDFLKIFSYAPIYKRQWLLDFSTMKTQKRLAVNFIKQIHFNVHSRVGIVTLFFRRYDSWEPILIGAFPCHVTHTHTQVRIVLHKQHDIYIYYKAGNRLEIWFTSNHIYILYVTFSVEGEDSSSPDI